MRIKMFLLGLILFGTMGCHDPYEKYVPLFSSFEGLEKSEYVIIIPTTGCDGCIQKSFEVVKNMENFKTSKVIITRIPDKKLINNYVKQNFPDKSNNIILDSKNVIMKNNLLDIYPICIQIKNGKISNIWDITKDTYNDVLTKINNK